MKTILISIFCGYLFNIVAGKTDWHYTFGKDCSVSIEHIDENKIVYADYDGKNALGYWCNYMSFIGRDDGYLNEYEICVTPETYEDPDCSLKLLYSSSYGGNNLEEYTCSNIPTTKYCGKQDDYFYITLKKVGNRDTSNARLNLKIEAVMTYNYGQTVGIIVGAVVGGMFLLSLVSGIVFYVACKGKRSPGRVMNPTGTTSSQQFNLSSGTHTSAHTVYPTQPPGYTPPQTNYSTSYSTPKGSSQGIQQPSGFTYNNQPPSYASVVNI